jgi:probable addiction module antidote protein
MEVFVLEEQELDASESSGYRNNPKAIAQYLNEAIASDDPSAFIRAIGTVLRAQNVVALSQETGLRRENLYRMFNGSRDPKLGNIVKIFASLGVQLTVKARKETQSKPPRPKLGRPRTILAD